MSMHSPGPWAEPEWDLQSLLLLTRAESRNAHFMSMERVSKEFKGVSVGVRVMSEIPSEKF